MQSSPLLHAMHAVRTGSAAVLAASLLAACAGNAALQKQQYDFGPYTGSALPSSKLQISLAEINVPAALDSNAMLYRLQYDNAQQLHPYAQARWSMPPAQLLAQRMKQQIALRGDLIVHAAEGGARLPVLHLDLDEFSQVFVSASDSYALINARAIVMTGREIRGQRNFLLQVKAASADAAGGARAMQQAADALVADMQQWLQGLPLH
ncbi:MAG: membrane integrity-associated transporter subunit PqiC [Burkholderiales bacterium]|nr:membrane integrity-associated transporter subunit PqiC [Burkholderiales bacterium]